MAQKTSLFRLTWPIYIELSFFMLLGIADTLMLSQFSDFAVAAVGNANRIMFLFLVVLNIIAIGVGVVVSQYIGAKEEREAKSAVRAGFIGTFFIGITLSILIAIFGPFILRAVGADPVIFDDAWMYLRIVSLGLFMMAMTQAAGQSFKSFGEPKTMMTIVGISNVLNILLNAVLIFGLGPIPRLGVTGAAIATLTSKAFALALSLMVMYKRHGVHPFILRLRPIRMHALKIIRIGLPSAAEQFIYQSSQVVLLSFMNSIGTLALTTQIYVFNLMTPVLIFALSMGQGNAVMVGWLVGAKDDDAAYIRTIRSMRIGLIIVFSLATMMYVLSPTLLGLLSTNPTVVSVGQQVLFIVIFLELGRLSNLVVIQALRATGDVLFPVFIGLISMWGIMLPLAYFLALYLGLGLVGIFIALASDEIGRGIMVFIRWTKKPWLKKVRLIDT